MDETARAPEGAVGRFFGMPAAITTAGGRHDGLRAAGTTVRTELLAGLTTVLTMAYIPFVNPRIPAVLFAARFAVGSGG